MRSLAAPALALLAAAQLGTAGPARAAPAAPRAPAASAPATDWRAEFEEVCGRTQDAMTLSMAELRSLVARADALLPKVEQLEPSQRKVMLTRLRACRALYQFMLESKEAG